MKKRVLSLGLLCSALGCAAGAAAEYAGEIKLPLNLFDHPAAAAGGERESEVSRLYLGTRYDEELGAARLAAGLTSRPKAMLELAPGREDLRLGLHCDIDYEGCHYYGASVSYGRIGLSVDPDGEEGGSASIFWRSGF